MRRTWTNSNLCKPCKHCRQRRNSGGLKRHKVAALFVLSERKLKSTVGLNWKIVAVAFARGVVVNEKILTVSIAVDFLVTVNPRVDYISKGCVFVIIISSAFLGIISN